VRVDTISTRVVGSSAELSALVTTHAAEKPFRVWYRFPAEYARYLRPSGSPFVAAMLMPAMALGEPLEIDAPVSARLLAQSRHLMDVFHSWWPELSKIEVTANGTQRAPGWRLGRRPSACFFSLGVDSYSTLLSNLDGSAYGTEPISSLIFVGGFDVRLRKESLLAEIDASLEKTAVATGTKPLRVDTNLRTFADRIVTWNQYHGSAMASVAIALERAFRTVYIASSYSYVDLAPWGSHPIPDPLWSTERLTFIHDGCKYCRAEKIARIAEVPVVQQTLRACWENRGERYNCGECEKCLRTMTVLEGLGVLERYDTFPHALDLDKLVDCDWTNPRVRRRFELVLDVVPDSPRNRALRDAIRRHLEPYAEHQAQHAVESPADPAADHGPE